MTPAERTTTACRRRRVLAAAIAAIGLAGAANAYADPADLTVVDRGSGQPMRVWRHHGRLFVAGEPGERYSLRLTNHTAGRVEVVVSVDGVNIVTGDTANVHQTGYLLHPYQSYDVTGWRKSTTEVAAFAFAPLPQSYAARTGRPGEVGVIGVAVYTEKAAPPPMAATPVIRGGGSDDGDRGDDSATNVRAEHRSAPPPMPAARAMEAPPPPPPPSMARAASPPPRFQSPSTTAAVESRRDEKLGTAHGAREWSPVHMVNFERATTYPVSVRQVEYDTYNNLVASGVIRTEPNPEPRPRPFPADPDGAGFVPDPPREP